MHRQLERDPTEFFSVVGAPYDRERVREDRAGEHHLYDRPVSAPRRRSLKIGFVTLGAGLSAVFFGISLFATSGAARLGEVAFQVMGK